MCLYDFVILCSSVSLSLSAIAHEAVLFVQAVSAMWCYFCPCVAVLQCFDAVGWAVGRASCL